jgi:hypothetical protein
MTSPQPLSDFLHREILPRMAVEAVYGSIGLARTGGRFWRGRCPFHPEGSSAFPIDLDWRTLRWSCLSGCHKGGQSLLAFLNDGHFPRPGKGELGPALQRAAELAGLPEGRVPDFTPEDEHLATREERLATLLETFFLLTHSALHAPGDSSEGSDSASARSWLVDQGFEPSSLSDLPIGLFVSPDAVRQGLLDAGFTAEEIQASALAEDPRLAGRLVGPIRDRWGRVRSFWARHPQERLHGFLFKGKWKEDIGLFGLDVALHPASAEHGKLIVVERLLNAILLQSMGLRNVAAVGGPLSQLGKSCRQWLSSLGVRQMILVPGPVPEGCGADVAAVAVAFQAKQGADTYVLPLESLGGFTSLGGLARAEGPEAVKAILEAEPVHAYSLKAKLILDRHKTGPVWSDAGRHAAWKEAIEFYAGQGRRAAGDLDRHFVPAIVAGLQRTWDTFEPLAESQRGSEPAGQAAHGPATGLGHSCPPRAKGPAETCPVHRCKVSVCFCFD